MAETLTDLESSVETKSFDYRQSSPLFRRGIGDFQTFFGQIREHDVTFCIDTSGSMYGCLDVVKEHLIRVLYEHSNNDADNTFNLVEFSTEVIQWADRMVKCTPETVQVAEEWISKLKPKTGTNTLDAVVAAFGDPNCRAVYLVTDSIPDQYPGHVIDEVVLAAGNRAVHCFYLQGGSPDSSTTEFLREMAMETFGSLHVVTVAHHGAIERVTPIYRAEMSAERIVRTTDGNVFPTNPKMCSITTTVGPNDFKIVAEPPTVIPAFGVRPLPYSLVMPPYPYCLYPWPYRHYYSYATPQYGWSRYRPAKAWLNHAKNFIDSVISVTPGAGALLIGTKVLARRHSDGLFYMGSVKSQILNNKFLVEFGPCKHGKYKDTEYQETFVYDIVSHADAVRHPVLVQDKVLAPLEHDGQRYAPGVAIDGQEKRIVEGGGPDLPLVIAFYDGKTVSVEKDRAVWIPNDLHERIVFELNLPKHVRKEFADKDCYPVENLSGYPTSGTKAWPPEFPRYVPPGWCETDSGVFTGSVNPSWYGGQPGYPEHLGRSQMWTRDFYPKTVSVKKNDVEQVIPGTDMTKRQLNEKVASQIRENEGKTENNEGDRLLKKRETIRENDLRKSVSFADLESAGRESDMRDSGHGSQTDLAFTDDDDYEYDDLELDDGGKVLTKRDVSSATDRSLLYPRRIRRSVSAGRRPWKTYWKNDPAPSLSEPLHYGQYRVGPYRDCLNQPTWLLRDAKGNQYYGGGEGVEWTSSMSRVVDPFAQYKYNSTVNDCMVHTPRPPSWKPDRQGPGRDLSDVLGEHQRPQELLADARRDYRQRQVLEREIGLQRRAAEDEYNQQLTLDHRRNQVHEQIHRNLQRNEQEQEKIQRHVDTKRTAQERHLQRMNDGLSEKELKEAQRWAYKSMQRENRVVNAAERNNEQQETAAKRQATKELQRVARTVAINAKVAEEGEKFAGQFDQRQRTQAARTAHLRHVENEAQKMKQLNDKIADDSKAMLRSLVII